MNETLHISVLKEETLEALRVANGGEFLDCTLGGGGHTAAILASNPENSVMAIDRDTRAIERARNRLSSYVGRFDLKHGSFADLPLLANGRLFDGILADLGLSTDQLKEERGFSFEDRTPLDMRMDETQDRDAGQIVNETSERELYIILRRGGVGDEARFIAREIVKSRPIENTKRLAEVINSAIHGRLRAKKGNPSTLVFQAIRMEVNQELEQIESLMDAVPALMKKGGRLAVITFHSLEDKAVAGRMRKWEAGDTRPANWPAADRIKPLGKLVSKAAIVPSEEEVAANPSSRSARLRVFEFV